MPSTFLRFLPQSKACRRAWFRISGTQNRPAAGTFSCFDFITQRAGAEPGLPAGAGAVCPQSQRNFLDCKRKMPNVFPARTSLIQPGPDTAAIHG
jgi:hypothetical protein